MSWYSYKQKIIEYKEEKNTTDTRTKPKAKKPKRFKLSADLTFLNKTTRVVIGHYATRADAEKAKHSFQRRNYYYSEYKIEEVSTIVKSI